MLAAIGCAHREALLAPHSDSQGRVEIAEVPFFPQRDFQCGPAALATVLVHSGVATSPDALRPQIYVPGRKGSFQVELLAAARRQGRIAYVLKPELRALMTEVAAGHPVVVLQNLGLESLPRWHFAVVVGFDPVADTVLLRSGTERSQTSKAHEFLRTWALGGQWAMLVLAPGELPASDDPDGFVRAVASLEKSGGSAPMSPSYIAAVRRWPEHRLARLGFANALMGEGSIEASVTEFEALAARDPGDAIVLNNLADGLRRLGCREQALEVIGRAARSTQVGGRIRAAIEATRREIEASAESDQAACARTQMENR